MNTEYNSDLLILAVSSSYGVYTPQTFGEWYADKCTNLEQFTEEFKDLENLDCEFYWESFDSILNSAQFNIDGKLYYAVQNEDVWFIPVGMELPENFWI